MVFGLSLLALAGAAPDGLVATTPDDLSATMRITEPSGAADRSTAQADFSFDRAPTNFDAAWQTVTGWQGGDEGLHVDHLRRVSATRYRTTEPMPVSGSWKTMVRLQDGRSIAAMPVFLPQDTVLAEPEVPATDGVVRPVGDERVLLQRELKDGVPGWLWLVAGLVVLACSLVLVLALAWGTTRYSRRRQEALEAVIAVAEPAPVPQTVGQR